MIKRSRANRTERATFRNIRNRSNQRLNEAIENMIRMWDGTIHGQTIRNMYENGSDYESICEIAGIEYEDYEEE